MRYNHIMKKKLSWFFGILAFLLLVGPLLIPVSKLEGLVDAHSLADSDSKFITVDGVELHYKDIGSGDRTYILFHGFGASTYSWRSVMERLSQTGRVIAFDRPGFGLSGRPTTWDKVNPYSPGEQVELTIGLMDALGISQAVMVGHSAGGIVALNTALRYYERVSALVLVDTPVYDNGLMPKWVLSFMNTPQANHVGPLAARWLQANGDGFLRSAWHDPSKITSDVYDGYNQPTKIKDWDTALWNVTKSTYSLEPEKYLANITMPTLVLSGSDDKIVPIKNSQRLAENIKGAQFASIADSGHLPQEEQPALFAGKLEAYLSEVRK